MDPVKLLPIEILLYIWSRLSCTDLLSCMAVCRTWRELIQQCSELWRPLCRTPKSQQETIWYSVFLEECKMKWPWKVGSFTEGAVIENYQLFCCTEDFIYITRNDKLCKYDQYANLIKEIIIGKGKQLYKIDKEIAILVCSRCTNEIKIFDKDLIEVSSIRIQGEIAWTSGDRLWATSADDPNLMVAYYSENAQQSRRTERILVFPGASLMPLKSGWCILYEGVVVQMADELREPLYRCDQTPMSRLFLTMFTNNKDIVVIIDKKIIAGKHIFCTIFIYRNGVRIHRADVPKQLTHWCFSGNFVVLASFKSVSSIELTTGSLFVGEEMKDSSFTNNIYGLQNIFDNTNLTLIVIDHGTNFIVYDVEKNCDLINIDCNRATCMTSIFKCTLLCFNNMFVYTLNDNKLKIKKTLLK